MQDQHRYKVDKIRIYIKSLKNDDPFPLLFIDIRILNELKDLITDEFNLKKKYIVDGDFNNVIINRSGYWTFKNNAGNTLTFKEIVDIINVKGLIEIFSFKSSFDLTAEELLAPPISLSKFLHEGILEPVKKPESLKISALEEFIN